MDEKVVLYSRLLVLEALEASQLSSVDLIHVQIAVYLQLILADAERDIGCVCERPSITQPLLLHKAKSFVTSYSSVCLRSSVF